MLPASIRYEATPWVAELVEASPSNEPPVVPQQATDTQRSLWFDKLTNLPKRPFEANPAEATRTIRNEVRAQKPAFHAQTVK